MLRNCKGYAMELKHYQRHVIDDLSRYLDDLINHTGNAQTAFNAYWQQHNRYAMPNPPSYQDKLNGVPNVCVKVPTAGGKTFIAVNALQPIFNAKSHYGRHDPRMVVWLVPSESILTQTLQNLRNLSHPYRQKLNVHFGGAVSILDKEQALRGTDFDVDSVQFGVTILVMTFDSLKGRSKETLRAYRENPNLSSFGRLEQHSTLDEYDESSLINVLYRLNPVIVIDESHNATTPLSYDMLKNLNPSFVLELTATPHTDSNIISYVGATELKSEQMVKLPLIIYKNNSQDDVIKSALALRNNLEYTAKDYENKGGAYIRPIVLFQAEAQSDDDKTTFDKVKQILLDIHIPETQIAIKTSKINELKGVDLLSPECEVRYIITVNALKEGWDCPFAYILASLANKSSVVDVTQIVGRVLRQPYAREHAISDLNNSYVFTSSDKFDDTLREIEKGLNHAGLSKHDYRVVHTQDEKIAPQAEQLELTASSVNLTPHNMQVCELDSISLADSGFRFDEQGIVANPSIDEKIQILQQQAREQAQAFSEQVAQANAMQAPPPELVGKTNMQTMRTEFTEMMADFRLPQFISNQLTSGLFVGENESVLLDKNNLLENFSLAKCDINISFEAVNENIVATDFDTQGGVNFTPLKGKQKQHFLELFKSQSDTTQQENLVANLFKLVGKKDFVPIKDDDIKKYFRRIIDDMTSAQREHCFSHIDSYFRLIKAKIHSLKDAYAKDEFGKQLCTGDIEMQAVYAFNPNITPNKLFTPLSHSLYECETDMNSFESQVLNKILQHDDIQLVWWHKIEEKKGFYINAFINHYPDFVLLTKRGNVILLETKGDHLDGSDSLDKIQAGQLWESSANAMGDGRKYRYMMVFDNKQVDGGFLVGDVLEILAKL